MAKISLDFTNNGSFDRLPSIEEEGIYTLKVAGVNEKDLEKDQKFGLIMENMDGTMSSYINISLLKNDGTKNGFATYALGNLLITNGYERPTEQSEFDTDDFKGMYAIVEIKESQHQGKITYQANILDPEGPSYFELQDNDEETNAEITEEYMEKIQPHVAEIAALTGEVEEEANPNHEIDFEDEEEDEDELDFDF